MTFNELRETLESLKNHTVQEVMAVVRQNCFIQTVEASEEGVGRRLDRPMFGSWDAEIFYAEKRMHMTRNEPHYFVTDEMTVLFPEISGISVGQLEELDEDGNPVQKKVIILETDADPESEEYQQDAAQIKNWLAARYEDYVVEMR